ncbi:hypothetical protein JB92DRAFT_3144751 [Gautieria morchelliformis]|nr:hypothetical protein JB92DRAFT_3144751 [Gautieria morchelliformis]
MVQQSPSGAELLHGLKSTLVGNTDANTKATGRKKAAAGECVVSCARNNQDRFFTQIHGGLWVAQGTESAAANDAGDIPDPHIDDQFVCPGSVAWNVEITKSGITVPLEIRHMTSHSSSSTSSTPSPSSKSSPAWPPTSSTLSVLAACDDLDGTSIKIIAAPLEERPFHHAPRERLAAQLDADVVLVQCRPRSPPSCTPPREAPAEHPPRPAAWRALPRLSAPVERFRTATTSPAGWRTTSARTTPSRSRTTTSAGTFSPDLDQQTLREMGIASLGDRIKMLNTFKSLRQRCSESHQHDLQQPARPPAARDGPPL